MRQLKVSGLGDHLGFWMRFVSNHVSRSFACKPEGQGVTVAERVILRELYEHADKASPADIIKQTGLTKGAVSKLIDRLCIKKLVMRLTSKHDRRYQEIGLTEQGRELVPKLARLADINDREFFAVLSRKDNVELDRILRMIVKKNKLNITPMN